MNCREARDRLTDVDRAGATLNDAGRRDAQPAAADPLARHLGGCRACSAYAARLAVARQILAASGADVEPDAAFASRVVAALPDTPGALTWAAVRLLPAALALVIVLAGWCVLGSRRPSALLEQAPSDDLLTWVLQPGEDAS